MIDCRGVTELPLRLLITVLIGGISLATVLAFVFSPCMFKKDLEVCWDTYKMIANNEATINVTVLDENGRPIEGATVLIKGLGNATVNTTNETGKAKLHIKVNLPGERNEGYLELIVNAGGCYKEFMEKEAIKVVRS